MKRSVGGLRLIALVLLCPAPVFAQALPRTPIHHAFLGSQDTSRGLELEVDPNQEKASMGPYYALVIGDEDYQFLPKLHTAANDARAIATRLREDYGFGTHVLIDATREQILNALREYREKLPPDSNLIIYYAGHGSSDPEAKVAYWLPVDAKSTNTANWISSEDITAELRVIKARHVLVIADSCYAGGLMRDADVDLSAELSPQERALYITKLEKLKSRNIMASGNNEPVADGGADGHSIFAAVLLRIFLDEQDPTFPATSVFEQLVSRVAGRSQQIPQYHPIVNSEHDGGDFVFLRQSATAAPPDLCCSAVGGDSSGVHAASVPAQPTAAEGIESVVNQYRDAYDAEDISELQNLWPTMSAQSVKNLQAFFQSARSVKLQVEIVGKPEVGPEGATVHLIEHMSYTHNGSPQMFPARKDTMRLIKQPGDGGSWKIESIQ